MIEQRGPSWPWLVIAVALGSCATCAGAGPLSAAPVASVTLQWTAPGDDGVVGVASRYDLRYSLDPITNSNFSSAAQVPNVPKPSTAGTREKVVVGGLTPSTLYYFAIKTADKAGNWSALSNVVRHTAPASGPSLPATVSLSAPTPNPARDAATFQLSLPYEAEVSIRVFDAAGRGVATMAQGRYPAGVTTFWWTLSNGGGLPVGSGRYWICGTVNGAPLVRTVAVVR